MYGCIYVCVCVCVCVNERTFSLAQGEQGALKLSRGATNAGSAIPSLHRLHNCSLFQHFFMSGGPSSLLESHGRC